MLSRRWAASGSTLGWSSAAAHTPRCAENRRRAPAREEKALDEIKRDICLSRGYPRIMKQANGCPRLFGGMVPADREADGRN